MNGKERFSINLGAWPQDNGVRFRLWAPSAETVTVVFDDQTIEPVFLSPESKGYFSGFFPGLQAGLLYRFRLDGKEIYPDPCSRCQPQGPHGPSMVVDPRHFSWQDTQWQTRGIALQGQVIYELHVGAFSAEGTYRGVMEQLAELKNLGITVVEIMPLAEFPGRWNWGYDGVGLFAPAHVYGTPDDLRALINEAHRLDLGVLLDVVYNHLGPDGNYLAYFSKDYFTDRYKNDWGQAINFDGPHSGEVREFFIQNACYWIEEFHFDGLRLDATQNIYDSSPLHVLAEMTQRMRQTASPKKILIIGENESQEVKMMTACDKGGYGLDGLLNDDFHHAARVALTGSREAYYTDYLGSPQEFISLFKYGYLYQGQFYAWQDKTRGSFVNDDITAAQFIIFLENHDQIANSLSGRRFYDRRDAGLYRALTALLLLGPQTPFIFMGQEFASSSHFVFFSDHHEKLGSQTSKGRKDFLCQFPSVRAASAAILDPQDKNSFQTCKLKFEERLLHKETYQLYRDLLKFRREDEIFNRQDRANVDGAVLGKDAFMLRYKGRDSARLLMVNFGQGFNLEPCPQPLLAPLPGGSWDLLWSSEEAAYGGEGTSEAFVHHQWRMQARSLQVFTSKRG